MGTAVTETATPRTRRSTSVTAMYAGMALSVLVMVGLVVDQATGNLLATHVSEIPFYGQARGGEATSVILSYLFALNAIGVIGWISMIIATNRGKRWAPAVSTAIFVIGTGIALVNLLIQEYPGSSTLPPAIGFAGLLPSVAGLVAVVALWRSRPTSGRVAVG